MVSTFKFPGVISAPSPKWTRKCAHSCPQALLQSSIVDSDDFPGPGKYSISGSFGLQIEGKRKTASALRLPPRLRPGLSLLEHAKSLSCEDLSPGAGRYSIRRNLSSLGPRFSQSLRPLDIFPSRPETTPCPSSVRLKNMSPALSFPRSKRPNTISGFPNVSFSSNFDRNFWRPVSFGLSYAHYKKVYYPGISRDTTCDVPISRSRSALTPRGVSFTRQVRQRLRSYSEDPGPGTYYTDPPLRKGNVPVLRNPIRERPRLDFRQIAKYS